LFKENNPEISFMINSIKNDLLNPNSLCQSMALTLIANLNNHELISNTYNEVLTFLTKFNEKPMSVVKKGLACLARIIKVKKDMHDVKILAPCLMKILELKYFECLLG